MGWSQVEYIRQLHNLHIVTLPSLKLSPNRRLASIVGRNNAIRLCGTAHELHVEEALRIGFADKVVEPCSSEFDEDDYSLEVCTEFLRPYLDMKYPGSIRAIKEAIGSVEACSPDDSIEIELDVFSSRWFSDDNVKELNKK